MDPDGEPFQFTQRLLSVIRGRKMFIISTAIILDDMVKVFPSWGQDAPGHAYGHAFAMVLAHLRRNCRRGGNSLNLGR